MRFSIPLLALALATSTSALPHPEVLSKRSGVNGAAYARTGSGSHGASWGGDKQHSGHSGWGPPHEKDRRGGTGSPGSSWGGHGGGHGGGGRGPPQQKQQQGGQQQEQQQQQQDSGDCETAQCLDDIQDNTFEGLPNRASPPPDGSLTATTKEKRGSPAPGDSWGEGSGGEHNGQSVGDDSDFWGP